MADSGDSDSDISYVLVSDGTSVGSGDSENYVIVDKDNFLGTDSDEDLFGESRNELEKVIKDDKGVSSDFEDDDMFCESQEQLEDDENNVSADSDEGPADETRSLQLKKLVDYSCSDSDEDLMDCGGHMSNGKIVANTHFHFYPHKRIGHVCGDGCHEFHGEKMADGNSDINDVTLEYVLPFLPAKTLCRFRTVGKRWDKWIKTPFFAHKQVNSFRNISGLFCQVPGEHPSFISLDKDAYGIPSPSLDFLPERVAVRTACNGLVCCSSCDGENTYYICNPVNKEWTVLPKSESVHGAESVLALAFEPSLYNFAAHFELVCAFSLPDMPVIWFDIYSSSTNSWKLSETLCCELDALLLNSPGFFLNGMVYWETLAGAILTFNLKGNGYGIFPLPPRSGPQGVIAEMHGELCYILPVVENSGCTLEIYGDMDMKLKFVIPLIPNRFVVNTYEDEDLRALTCVKDDVVIIRLGRKLTACNVKSKKADLIYLLPGAGTVTGFAGYIPYVNSLVHIEHP